MPSVNVQIRPGVVRVEWNGRRPFCQAVSVTGALAGWKRVVGKQSSGRIIRAPVVREIL